MEHDMLGLKVGLEIHQQLDTHKLFCNCPSTIRDDEADVFAIRRLKAVVGELGVIDRAASHEEERGKRFRYAGYSDSTCLVEFDEEPPKPLNKEALATVLSVAKHFHAEIVDEIEVMRKNVVDGSNTAGFQRTALVALNGKLGEVRIANIAVEEDSAKIMSRTTEEDAYNVSRLGIPLIEIGTMPDIKSPEQAYEIAAEIGMILRSTGKVKRGLGTIRQDVNVSIKGGERIEIKGCQDLKQIPALIRNEMMRQENILGLQHVFSHTKASELIDVSSVFSQTQCRFVKKALDGKGGVFGFSLSGMDGIVGKEIQTGKRIGTDFSDYAKVKAGVGGIIHSDEDMHKYQFSEKEIEEVSMLLQMKDKDAFLLIVADKKTAYEAYAAVKERIMLLSKGIPKEVRKANDDGTTSFLRPISNEARMYPETDIVPVVPEIGHIPKIVLLTERIDQVKKRYNLSDDLARDIVHENLSLFTELAEKAPKEISAAFIAEMIVGAQKTIKAQFSEEVLLSDDDFRETSGYLFSSAIPKSAVYAVLKAQKNRKEAVASYKTADDPEIENVIAKIVSENPGVSDGALMGMCMKALGGKVDGKKVNEILKKVKR